MLLTPIKVARGALLKFCRICERREGPGSGFGIVYRARACQRFPRLGVCLMLCAAVPSVPFIRVQQPHPLIDFIMNMDEGDTLVRRRSRRSTAGNR
jgi:hypothetical protein